MAYVTRTFDNMEELVDYLNDVVVGSSLLAGSRVYGLNGLTLIINTPTIRTVTFSDPSEQGLLPKEILDQIHAVNAELVTGVGLRNYGHAAPPKVALAVKTAGYVVDKDGTANSILGFPTAVDTTVGANAVVKADIVAVSRTEGNRISVLHE